MNLSFLCDHFKEIYRKRNCVFLPSLLERINTLNLTIGDLQEAIRKYDNEVVSVGLARVVAHIICVADQFHELPFVEIMGRKYHASGCARCHDIPCCCTDCPKPACEMAPDPSQSAWTLTAWCQYFDRLYGERNRRKGLENVLNRLFKETSELLALAMNTSYWEGFSLEEIYQEFARELVDTLAWTIAVANILGIDLEAAVLKRYGSGCWACRKQQCECLHFDLRPVDWSRMPL